MAESASDLKDRLENRRETVVKELEALDATKAGGKPNTSGGGTNVDHVNYRMSLYKELAEIDRMLSKLTEDEGPYEVEVRGIT